MAKKQAKKKTTKVVKKTGAKVPGKVKKTAKAKPAKKASKKKGEDLMCFLTTACVSYYRLPDNCSELTILRKYRDEYLRQTEAGKELVNEYYRVGPQIAQQIIADKKRSSTYRYIYGEIKLACDQIMCGENESAQKVYVSMVEKLKNQYLN